MAIGDLYAPVYKGCITPHWLQGRQNFFPLFHPAKIPAGDSESRFILALGVNANFPRAKTWLSLYGGPLAMVMLLAEQLPKFGQQKHNLPEEIESGLLTSLQCLGSILEQESGNLLSKHEAVMLHPEFVYTNTFKPKSIR